MTHAGSNLRSSKSTGSWEEDDIISLYAKAAGSKPGDVVASLCRGAVGDSSGMHLAIRQLADRGYKPT